MATSIQGTTDALLAVKQCSRLIRHMQQGHLAGRDRIIISGCHYLGLYGM